MKALYADFGGRIEFLKDIQTIWSGSFDRSSCSEQVEANPSETVLSELKIQVPSRISTREVFSEFHCTN